MRKLLLLAMVFMFAASLAYAQKINEGYMKLKGIIIDNICVKEHKADIADFVKTHPKGCALDPEAIDSGYSIYTDDGKLMSFDEASNSLISEFLQKPESTTQVDVEAQQADYGEGLTLVTIKNQV